MIDKSCSPCRSGWTNQIGSIDRFVDIIVLVKPIGMVDPIGLKNSFSVSKLKFFMKLVLIEICILALSGSFCCKPLIAFFDKNWNFSSYYQLTKLLFLKVFSLNITFLGIELQVVTCKTMLIATFSFLGVAATTFSLNIDWVMYLWK